MGSRHLKKNGRADQSYLLITNLHFSHQALSHRRKTEEALLCSEIPRRQIYTVNLRTDLRGIYKVAAGLWKHHGSADVFLWC